jgi:hypothetical protein
MGVAAAGAVVAAVSLGRARAAAAASRGHTVYVCPMHPEIRATAAGACPVCGMDLEPIVDRSSAFLSIAAARPQIGSAVAERLLYSGEVRAPASVVAPGTVEAHVHTDELALIDRDAAALFSNGVEGAPATDVRALADPPAPWDESTSVVRLAMVGSDGGATPAVGAAGWVTLAAQPRPALMVPAGGILHGPAGAFVIVLGPCGSFERRRVQIGKVINRNAFVVAGLDEHERIAVNEGLLLDAERKNHPASGRGDPAP